MGLKIRFQLSLDAQSFAQILSFRDIFDHVKKILKSCEKFAGFHEINSSCDNEVSPRDYIVKISSLEIFSKSQKLIELYCLNLISCNFQTPL